MASSRLTILCLMVAVCPAAANRQQLRGLRADDMEHSAGAMQPTVVARTLSRVEMEWRSQALQFVECRADTARSDCGLMQKAFQKSCGTVVNAVVAASSGNRDTVKEYMGVVCNEPDLRDWKQERCHSFAEAISGTMTADTLQNRVNFNTGGLCRGFWTKMSTAEGARVAREHELQAKLIEEERVKAAKRAKEAAEKLARETAAKNRKLAAEARQRELQEKKKKLEEEHKQKLADIAAREAKFFAEREAAKRAKAAKRATEKAAAEAAARAKHEAVEAEKRQRLEAAVKAAETQAASADAKLAKAETAKHQQHQPKSLAKAEAAKHQQHQPKSLAKAVNADQSAKKAAAATHPAKAQKASQTHAVATSQKINSMK